MLWFIMFVVVMALVIWVLIRTQDTWVIASHPKGSDLNVVSCNNPIYVGVLTLVRGRIHDGDQLWVKRIIHDKRGEFLQVSIRPGSGAATLRVKNGNFSEDDTLRVESYY